VKSVEDKAAIPALNHSSCAGGLPEFESAPHRTRGSEREVGEQTDVGRLGRNREPCQQRGYGDNRLCHSEVAPDAAAKAAGKREVGVSRARLLGSRFESRRIEPLGVRPEIRAPMGRPLTDQDDRPGWDPLSSDGHGVLGEPA
jgi:hypothetical protein